MAASIAQTLGVQIDLQTVDQGPFMEQLASRGIPFGWVTYGMDYLDATNMLSVWKSGGRHNWNNAEFDALVEDGGAITDDPAARSKAMKDAERLLVESAAGAFVYHPLIGQLHKPYRMGSWKEPNATGYTGAQWPGESPMTLVYDTLYQGAGRRDHAQGLTERPSGGEDARATGRPRSLPAEGPRHRHGLTTAAATATVTQDRAPVLEIRDLNASFFTRRGEVHAVRDVSFSLRQGETLALVGRERIGQDRHGDVHPADAPGQGPRHGRRDRVRRAGPAAPVRSARWPGSAAATSASSPRTRPPR